MLWDNDNLNYTWINSGTGNFRTQYCSYREEPDAEENDGTIEVIAEGYIDTKTQIRNMILAGERLNAYRNEYDYQYEDDDYTNDDFAIAIAQIRHPNTDISEIESYTEAIKERMDAAKSIAEKRAAAQALDIGGTYKTYDKPNYVDTDGNPVSNASGSTDSGSSNSGTSS